MSARTGMLEIIPTLRGLTDATEADYTVAGVTYWTDDELQRVLDRHRLQVNREMLVAREEVELGAVEYHDYYSRWGNYERTDGGTAIFIVEDANGSEQGTALWTADYPNGIITFASDTGGSIYYLTGRSFDLYAAAAEVWRMKAGHFAIAYDVTAGGDSLRRSQLMQHCREMALYYGSMKPVEVANFDRGDT